MTIRKSAIFLIFTILFYLSFQGAYAAMLSNSYVIYENVMHAFDGPVISNVSHSVSAQNVSVSWNTNVPANSFVIYGTDGSLSSSREQGSSAKIYTSHNVSLSGLEPNTTYYYRVSSERVNGGKTTNATIRSFTTGSGAQEPITPVSGGGGVLIIDKTDNTPPVISNVRMELENSSSVKIFWETDEESSGFVEYGTGLNYGSVYGQWIFAAEHSIVLRNLDPATEYNFRAIGSDRWGNIGYSENFVFTTKEGIKEGEGDDGKKPNDETGEDDTDAPDGGRDEISQEEALRAITIFNRLFPGISLGELTPGDMSNFLSSPEVVGVPRVEAGSNEAAIFWRTNIEANSMVAISPDNRYRANPANPYMQVVGNSEVYTINHEVSIYGLLPDTLYHFQLQNKSNFGPIIKSPNYTFRTAAEELRIVSFFSQVMDNQTAIFKWVTNKNSDSSVKVVPYYGNELAVDEAKIFKDNNQAVIHEIEIKEFQEGVFYEVELSSTDLEGRTARESFNRFSTSAEDLPPVISHIKADSTIYVEYSDKIQTVISWITNEPCTSRILYKEGVHGADAELTESTELNTNYTKKHIVLINNFKPGTVYTFKVESVDSGGNKVISKSNTFMTAKKKESIIQIILAILEETFGWLRNII
jgi:hypothetical protein